MKSVVSAFPTDSFDFGFVSVRALRFGTRDMVKFILKTTLKMLEYLNNWNNDHVICEGSF